MKNLKKMLAVVTAISAMLASVPAFAALDLSEKDAVIDTFTCTGEDTTSPSVTASVAANAVDDGEMTFLILNDGASVLNIQAEDILYIDQHSSSAGTSFTGVINLERIGENLSALPEGDYPVRIGYNSKTTGEFAIAEATLKVGEDSTGGTTVTILWGDVNQDEVVDANDSTKLLNWIIGGSAICGDYTIEEEVTTGLVWGDVNQDEVVDANDSTKLLNWIIGGSAICGEYTIEETASVTINN